MKCLCCRKIIPVSASAEEKKWHWHTECVKEFFDTAQMPELDISKEQLKTLVNKKVNKGLTVPGVQKKLSLHLSNEPAASRLTIVDYPTGYILKPQTELFEFMPEFEDLAMHLADLAGIDTVPHALLRFQNTYAYITKRIDREIQPDVFSMYAMEVLL